MYFESRIHAGQVLAAQLYEQHWMDQCVVVALSDGGVQIGEQIAGALNCPLSMLVIEHIPIPGENINFGAVTDSGLFTTNSSFSSGEVDEYNSEFHGYFEEQKREAFQKINRLVGEDGTISRELLGERVVILATDGLSEVTALDSAVAFLKPIHVKRIVMAVPVASVAAVDRMHIVADELHVLSVKENYISTDHYYDLNDIPDHETTVRRVTESMAKWV